MKNYAVHRRAKFDYEILDTYEAGLVLSGQEVKAIRAGKAKLEGGHVVVRGGEAYVVGISIAPYQPVNMPKDYESDRVRKLLLSKKELAVIETKTEQRGLTAVPLRLYNHGRTVKLEIAVVRGKKLTDKRQSIQARDTKRDIEREMKQKME